MAVVYKETEEIKHLKATLRELCELSEKSYRQFSRGSSWSNPGLEEAFREAKRLLEKDE